MNDSLLFCNGDNSLGIVRGGTVYNWLRKIFILMKTMLNSVMPFRSWEPIVRMWMGRVRYVPEFLDLEVAICLTSST